eukprot:7776815-Karenia_brevis.AAC.1
MDPSVLPHYCNTFHSILHTVGIQGKGIPRPEPPAASSPSGGPQSTGSPIAMEPPQGGTVREASPTPQPDEPAQKTPKT